MAHLLRSSAMHSISHRLRKEAWAVVHRDGGSKYLNFQSAPVGMHCIGLPNGFLRQPLMEVMPGSTFYGPAPDCVQLVYIRQRQRGSLEHHALCQHAFEHQSLV